MERVRRIRRGISPHDSAERFKALGVDVFFGEARFADADTILVGDRRLRFSRAVIATGARPIIPPIPGLAEARPLTNETVVNLTEQPRRLAVIGGGPIGCELAQAFQRLGTRVILFHELTTPWCTYTDPEIARVGMNEDEERERGIELDTYCQPLDKMDRAITDGETEGCVKIHTRKGASDIHGATIVARHAGVMISEISVAMAGKIGLGRLANVIHPYPTQAEAVRKCGDAYHRRRLTPRVKRLFELWLRCTRRERRETS